MPPFELWERTLGFGIAGLSGVLAIRLWSQGLARLYPFFTFFLCYGAIRSLLFMTVKVSPAIYFYVFVVTELIQMALYVLMLLELYNKVFQQYRGIRAVSRLAMSIALGLSILVSVVSLGPEMEANDKRRAEAAEKAKAKATAEAKKPGGITTVQKPAASDSRWLLDLFMIAERAILSALVLMILAMSVFLGWYPIELPRNVAIHSIVFAAFFLSKGAIILYRNVGHYQVAREWRSAILVVGVVCLLAWISGLRRSGEATTTVLRRTWNRSNEQELVAQLKGINAALGRLARE